MEIDAWEIIAIMFCYFLFLWGFRFAFFGGIAKMIGGMVNGSGSKVQKSSGSEKENTADGATHQENP